MHKLLFFFTVCLAISLSVAHRDNDRAHLKKKHSPRHMENKPFGMEKKLGKLCSNNTLAQAYLTQLLSAIGVLQANSGYSSILKTQSANYIAYLQNTANHDLLRTDCEGFMKGLKVAEKADKDAEREQRKLAKEIKKQLKQVIHKINNDKEYQELDI